jgi:hypothetical protein
MEILINNITWIVEADTDKEYAEVINEYGLPTALEVDTNHFADDNGNYTKEDITSYLSDEFGVCPDDFKVEVE